MKELREKKSGYTRTVMPFKDDPEVTVEVRALSTSERNEIWDRCGVRLGVPEKNTAAKLSKANEEMIRRQIVGWKGFVDHGEPVVCTDDTKLRVLDATFSVINAEGEKVRKPLWAIVNEAFEEAEEADEKN